MHFSHSSIRNISHIDITECNCYSIKMSFVYAGGGELVCEESVCNFKVQEWLLHFGRDTQVCRYIAMKLIERCERRVELGINFK